MASTSVIKITTFVDVITSRRVGQVTFRISDSVMIRNSAIFGVLTTQNANSAPNAIQTITPVARTGVPNPASLYSPSHAAPTKIIIAAPPTVPQRTYFPCPGL